jgi:hypothetical protein
MTIISPDQDVLPFFLIAREEQFVLLEFQNIGVRADYGRPGANSAEMCD